MSGNIVMYKTYDIIAGRFDGYVFKGYCCEKSPLDGNTGVLVFSKTQLHLLKILKESGKYSILYESKPCVNPNYKYDGPRNTVVIFEEKEPA